MIPRPLFTAVVVALAAMPALAAPQPSATPADAIAGAPASAWRTIPAEDLVVFDLTPDDKGTPRRFVLQLLPKSLSSPWTRNIRALARAGFWDGSAIYRVQDNWVTQWGDATEKKPLPATLAPTTKDDFDWPWRNFEPLVSGQSAGAGKPSTFAFRDPYAPLVGYVGGVPIGSDGRRAWPLHCYASVGVARGTDNAGTGSELYAVIGHAPRQLDRNIAVAGRIVEGMPLLAALPRGENAMGFYGKDQAQLSIIRARLASDMPADQQPKFEYLDPGSQSFRAYAAVSANRHDDFYLHGAGGMDICNLKVPIRAVAPR